MLPPTVYTPFYSAPITLSVACAGRQWHAKAIPYLMTEKANIIYFAIKRGPVT